MAITPQAIKDQEFQVKFRGYDAIEVKAYLELVAEEFFELFEQVRQHDEEIETLAGENQDLIDLQASLEGDIDALQGKNDRLTSELAQVNERNAVLGRELDDLKGQYADLEQKKGAVEEELAAAREEIAAKNEIIEIEKKEKEDLGDRLTDVERRWAEQKKVEIDFKETLLAAQKFSRDMRKSSEDEASRIIDRARADAEKLRQDTFQELARYPKEIERMRIKRNQVCEDLRTVLTMSLENLDIFNDENEDDFSDLFQSVVVSDEGMVNREEMSKLGMELDLLEAIHAEEEGVADGKEADTDQAA